MTVKTTAVRKGVAVQFQESTAPTSGETHPTENDDSETSGLDSPNGADRLTVVPVVDDVEEVARIRLQHSPYRGIRRVGCTFANGVLTLTGGVPTYHYKQLAQTAVGDIAGIDKIVNAIDVG